MKRFTLVVLFLILAGVVAHAQTPPPAPAAAPRADCCRRPVPATPPNPGTKIGDHRSFRTLSWTAMPGKAAVAEIQKAMEPAKTPAGEAVEGNAGPADKAAECQDRRRTERSLEETSTAKSVEGQARAGRCPAYVGRTYRQSISSPLAMLVNKIVEEYAKDNNLAVVMDPCDRAQQHHLCRQALGHHQRRSYGRMNAAYAKDPKITAPMRSSAASAARCSCRLRPSQ